MKQNQKRNPNQVRINFFSTPETKAAVRELSKRWNMKTNDTIARAISDCLHRPLASSPKPKWAEELEKEMADLKRTVLEYWE